MKRNAIAAILIGGFIAGALDLTYAVGYSAYHGVAPMRILQSVASGLLGASAHEGGVPTAILGVALHFFISICAAGIFWLASRRFGFLTRRPIVSGAVFGFFVYLTMTFVVLPLSAFPRKVTLIPSLVATDLIVHMFLFGLSIALVTRRFSRA